jgi:hypothetical protein
MTEKDIWFWIENFVEKNHKFYDYKFPPCPFAKSARLKKLVSVSVYHTGSMTNFIKNKTYDLINSDQNVCVMAFPNRVKWYLHVHWFIRKFNKLLIPNDYYIQYGKTDKFFVIIVNKLSDVLSGHQTLLSTNYYKNWDADHYKKVVVRRQHEYENL